MGSKVGNGNPGQSIESLARAFREVLETPEEKGSYLVGKKTKDKCEIDGVARGDVTYLSQRSRKPGPAHAAYRLSGRRKAQHKEASRYLLNLVKQAQDTRNGLDIDQIWAAQRIEFVLLQSRSKGYIKMDDIRGNLGKVLEGLEAKILKSAEDVQKDYGGVAHDISHFLDDVEKIKSGSGAELVAQKVRKQGDGTAELLKQISLVNEWAATIKINSNTVSQLTLKSRSFTAPAGSTAREVSGKNLLDKFVDWPGSGLQQKAADLFEYAKPQYRPDLFKQACKEVLLELAEQEFILSSLSNEFINTIESKEDREKLQALGESVKKLLWAFRNSDSPFARLGDLARAGYNLPDATAQTLVAKRAEYFSSLTSAIPRAELLPLVNVPPAPRNGQPAPGNPPPGAGSVSSVVNAQSPAGSVQPPSNLAQPAVGVAQPDLANLPPIPTVPPPVLPVGTQPDPANLPPIPTVPPPVLPVSTQPDPANLPPMPTVPPPPLSAALKPRLANLPAPPDDLTLPLRSRLRMPKVNAPAGVVVSSPPDYMPAPPAELSTSPAHTQVPTSAAVPTTNLSPGVAGGPPPAHSAPVSPAAGGAVVPPPGGWPANVPPPDDTPPPAAVSIATPAPTGGPVAPTTLSPGDAGAPLSAQPAPVSPAAKSAVVPPPGGWLENMPPPDDTPPPASKVGQASQPANNPVAAGVQPQSTTSNVTPPSGLPPTAPSLPKAKPAIAGTFVNRRVYEYPGKSPLITSNPPPARAGEPTNPQQEASGQLNSLEKSRAAILSTALDIPLPPEEPPPPLPSNLPPPVLNGVLVPLQDVPPGSVGKAEPGEVSQSDPRQKAAVAMTLRVPDVPPGPGDIAQYHRREAARRADIE
jgi:hypothetical protein